MCAHLVYASSTYSRKKVEVIESKNVFFINPALHFKPTTDSKKKTKLYCGNVYCIQTNQYCKIFVGRYGRCVLKNQKKLLLLSCCFQQQVQKPGSVMVWGCISAFGKAHFHFCDGALMQKSSQRL